MLYSRRRRPELPPSSVTVTTAARSEIGCDDRSLVGEATYSFNPRRTVESPVPPPRATIRTERLRCCECFFNGGGESYPAEPSRSG